MTGQMAWWDRGAPECNSSSSQYGLTRKVRVGADLRCLDSGEIRGFARYTRALTAALMERADVEVIGYCTDPRTADVPCDTDVFPAGSELWSEQVWIPTWAVRRKADVLWCPANRGLPFFSPIPTVLTLHDAVEWDTSFVPSPRGRTRARFAYASVCSLASAAQIIAPSSSAKVAIMERLRIASERVTVIHEAADPSFHRAPSAAETATTLRRHSLVPGYVLYVGGLDPKKDVATLLRAASRRAPTEAVTVIAGAADGAWSYLAGSAGTAKVVRVESPTDDELRSLYAAAGCFVFPAVAEGFGLPVVEAMAAGVPVLGAEAGALPEVIGPGGQLFPPGDDERLADLIGDLLNSEVLRTSWAAKATARAHEMSWTKTATATARVFSEAAAVGRMSTFSSRVLRLRSWRAWMPPPQKGPADAHGVVS